MHVIEISGVVYSCPLYDRFRPHSAAELAYLVETVGRPGTEGGIKTAVRLYRDTDLDLDGCVLDGVGRLTAAAHHRLDNIPKHHHGALSTDEAYRIAKVLNDCRRHELTRADIDRRRNERAERREKVVELRSRGVPLREIARAVGAGIGSVQLDVKVAEASGHLHRSEPEPDEKGPDETDEGSDEEIIDSHETEPLPTETNGADPDPDRSFHVPHRQPWMNGGGNKVDPDHPFVDILKAMTALKMAFTRAVKRDDKFGKRLVEYLLVVQNAKIAMPPLVNPRAMIVGEKKLKSQFIGLDGLRNVIKLAGCDKSSAAKTVLKEFMESDREAK